MPRVSNVFQRCPHLHDQRAFWIGTQRHFGHRIGEPSGARIGVPCMGGGGRHVLQVSENSGTPASAAANSISAKRPRSSSGIRSRSVAASRPKRFPEL